MGFCKISLVPGHGGWKKLEDPDLDLENQIGLSHEVDAPFKCHLSVSRISENSFPREILWHIN